MTESTTNPKIGWFRSLYDWMMANAAGRHAWAALFGFAFAESSFFPLPPDLLLIPMVLADRRRAFLIAAVCTAGSVIGGMLGYAIGYLLFDSDRQMVDLALRIGRSRRFSCRLCEMGPVDHPFSGTDADPVQNRHDRDRFCRIPLWSLRADVGNHARVSLFLRSWPALRISANPFAASSRSVSDSRCSPRLRRSSRASSWCATQFELPAFNNCNPVARCARFTRAPYVSRLRRDPLPPQAGQKHYSSSEALSLVRKWSLPPASGFRPLCARREACGLRRGRR